MSLFQGSATQAQGANPSTAPLAERIAHTEPGKYRHSEAVHDGAGSMEFGALLGANALSTNFLFLHRGIIQPKSGIGQHFHNACEEMYVILDGEAEFTINGRTSILKGNVGAPTPMGSAHGIYNPGDKPIEWININVGSTKQYDTFNLGDPRVGVPIDPIPQFMTLKLDRSLLRPVNGMDGGTGAVQYRRALEPTVFRTPWSYVDHIVVPPGASVGTATRPDISEVYYVISGDGTFTVGNESAPVRKGDAVPIDLNQSRSIKSGSAPLELMVIGVARDMAAKAAFMAANAPGPRAGR